MLFQLIGRNKGEMTKKMEGGWRCCKSSGHLRLEQGGKWMVTTGGTQGCDIQAQFDVWYVDIC